MSKSKMLKNLEDEAPNWLRHINAYLAYEGENPMYERKADMAMRGVSNTIRLKATETNIVANILNATRMLHGGLPVDPTLIESPEPPDAPQLPAKRK